MPAIDRRWIVFGFCAIYACFTFGLISTGFTFWIGPWGQDFKVPRSLIMAAYTAANLVLVLVGPFVGRALDFISVRTCVVVGAVVMAAGLALATLAQDFWLLLIVYSTIVPIGGALAGTLPATVMGVRMFPERAGLINGLMALVMALSGIVMSGYAATVIGPEGWRTAFLIAAGLIGLIVAPIGWFMLNIPAGAPAGTLKPEPVEGVASAEGFTALKQPMFWILVAATLPVMFVLTSVPTSLAPIAADAGITTAKAAAVVSAFAASAATGSLAGGWLADRISARLLYGTVLAAMALVLLIMSQRPGLAVLTGAMVILGLGGGSLMPWTGAVIMRCFGAEAFARVFGLVSAFFIPATFAPILFGWIRDQTGGYQAAFLVFIGLLSPGLISLLLLKPPAKPVLVPAE